MSDRSWRHEEAVDLRRDGRNGRRGMCRAIFGVVVPAPVALGRRLT